MIRLIVFIGCLIIQSAFAARNETDKRFGKAFSLFSVVQFPNEECTSSDSSTTVGTCITTSECTSRGGTSGGNCAAGFGVCCIISTTTCGSTISTNTTYIRNPGYPSTFTATSAGTCTYRIEKASDDICQLRLDFETFSGFTTTATPQPGACQDTFAAAGQTGSNPPTICGTNSGYHMYVEFGTSSTDMITLTNTWAAGGLATAKSYNILARQIPCGANYKAPVDCVQYFTGISGSVQTYNHQGSQLLHTQNYQNCIRTEKGYCRIQWKQSSTTSPDPFQLAGANIDATDCDNAFINIPNLSPDGINPIPVPIGAVAFQSEQCGVDFGIENGVAEALVSAQQPFVLGVFTDASSLAAMTGINMDYTQLAC